jgi:hypothetical protein
MLGQVSVLALNNAQKDIRGIITRPDNQWFNQKKFRVISLDAGYAIINAGTADGIEAGDRFQVFTEKGIRVGKINILNVWSDHVSKAEILEGRDEIRPNDIIMPAE